MRWFSNDPTDDGTASAAEASRPWWGEAPGTAGVPPHEPDFDAVVGGQHPVSHPVPAAERRNVLGGLPRSFEQFAPPAVPTAQGLPPAISPSPVPPRTVPVFRHVDDATAVEPVFAAPVAEPQPGVAAVPPAGQPAEAAVEGVEDVEDVEDVDMVDVDDTDGGHDDGTGDDAVPSNDIEEPPVLVGTDEGTYADDVTAEPAVAAAPATPDEEIPVPVAEITISFGERIERLIAAAVAEAENTSADARHEAAELLQSARLDAEHTLAAAQRQSAEIVAASQRRCDDELAAAQRAREEAEQVLADARAEAEALRRRVRDEVAELRSEIDLHAQAMLARTHAETSRTLTSARAELEELGQRKTELEAQLASIRALLSEAVVEPLPQGLGGLRTEPQEPSTPRPAAAPGVTGRHGWDPVPAPASPVDDDAPSGGSAASPSDGSAASPSED